MRNKSTVNWQEYPQQIQAFQRYFLLNERKLTSRSAKLSLRKAGGEQQDFFSITLEKARVATYDIDVDHEGQPVERITLSFQKVAVEYRNQSATGQMGGT